MHIAVVRHMRRNYSIIRHSMIARCLVLLVCLLSIGETAIATADTAVEDARNRFFTLVNEARKDPVGQARAFGVNTDTLFAERPWLLNIVTNGLSQLNADERIGAAADYHTADILEKGYYAEVSPDGKTPLDRIRDAGYPADSAGEALGMITFVNFLPPKVAGELMFRNMFLRELSSASAESLILLSPTYTDAGVSIRGGVVTASGLKKNAYVVCFDAATQVMHSCELELIELINEARANPLGIAESLGIDTAVFLERRPELRAAFEQGLSPLTINGALSSASAAHVRDMLENNYYGRSSLDGRTYQERIEQSGYRFDAAGESLGITWFTDPIDPLVAVDRIFERMLRDELEPSNAGNLTILDPRMKEAGIALGKGFLRSESEAWNIYLAICDVGLPSSVVQPVAP